VLEDDVKFGPNFATQWNERSAFALPADAELVFLGGVLPANQHRHTEAVTPINRLFASHDSTNFFNHIGGWDAGNSTGFHYEAVSYLLSSAGAKRLVQFVVQTGFTMPVDLMLLQFMRTSDKVYVATPLLAAGPDPVPELVYGGDSDAKGDSVPIVRT
jgi:hypothetical protein